MAQEDWGEKNAGKRTPGIFVLDLATYSVQQATGLPGNTSAGQPTWTPDGMSVIAWTSGCSFLTRSWQLSLYWHSLS